MKRRMIRKSKRYPARIIAVKSGTREFGGGKYRGTIRTYGLKVRYAEGVKYINVDDQDPVKILEKKNIVESNLR